MAKSDWREACRPTILAALATLPPGSTRKDAERLLRPLYPWGPRENHPYLMWRKEVVAQLDVMFGRQRYVDPKCPGRLTSMPPGLFDEGTGHEQA